MATTRAVLTPRGWSIVAGGLISLLVGFFALNLLLVLVGVTVMGFAAADLARFAWTTRAFERENFRLQRSENSSLIGMEGVGTMAVRVDSTRKQGFHVEIYDRQSDGLAIVAGEPHLLSWWEPGTSKQLAYAYRPLRRGVMEVGPVFVTAHDSFGFAFRMTSLEGRWPVEVLPQVALWKTEINARLRGELLGRLLSHRAGIGTEFRSLRDYQESDDYRTIVWKRSTFEHLLVRESEVENRINVALLLDVSRSMSSGVPGADALDVAVEAALLLARYAFSQGDRVSVLLYTDHSVAFLPLGRHVEQGFEVDRAVGEASIAAGAFDFEGALAHLAERLTQPSAIFAFTALEPLSPPPSRAYSRLRSSGHRVFTFVPDLPGFYPVVSDPLLARSVEFAAGPELRQRKEAVERLTAAGIPVVEYDRRGLLDLVTSRYAGLRAGAWES